MHEDASDANAIIEHAEELAPASVARAMSMPEIPRGSDVGLRCAPYRHRSSTMRTKLLAALVLLTATTAGCRVHAGVGPTHAGARVGHHHHHR